MQQLVMHIVGNVMAILPCSLSLTCVKTALQTAMHTQNLMAINIQIESVTTAKRFRVERLALLSSRSKHLHLWVESETGVR